MLPIRDILAIEKTKATRFGHHGLIVIIKGYEELFFEFGLADRRLAFVTLLERQMDLARHTTDVPLVTQGKRDALLLEEFEANASGSNESDHLPAVPENMTDSLPAIMFTSSSSTFLTFKPKESLLFTFLTIGSRGDVQPYIALAKPLMADGHRVKIATHGEFKEWIESVRACYVLNYDSAHASTKHGIEYAYVGGDPAELMRICVENGTFTLSFMKEGLSKVYLPLRKTYLSSHPSIIVPRLGGRSSGNLLGGMSRQRRPHREPKRNGWLPYCRSARNTILQGLHYDMVAYEVDVLRPHKSYVSQLLYNQGVSACICCS